MNDLAKRKLTRVREQMRRAGATAMIVAENARTRYLTGYQRYFSGTYLPFVHAVVVTVDAGPVLLLPPHIMGSADELTAEGFEVFPFALDGKIAIFQSVLRDHCVEGVIAVEFDFMHFEFVERLKREFPRARFVDAGPIMRNATAIKFAEEISLIREAARLVDEGVKAAVDAVREGATELDIAAQSSACMLKGGAEFINHMTVRSGPHAAGLFPIPTARAIQRGECVQIDIGCVYQGYVSDTNRTVVAGRPSPEQRKLFDVGQGMLEAGIAVVREGVKASDVWQAAYDVAQRAGLADLMTIPFAGHGIGLGLHEQPLIVPGSQTILQENMVLALEPGLYSKGVGTSRPEDMLLVTKAGCEVLTHYPRDYDLMVLRTG
jgi:Xaa-Pro aminopeptidase